MNTENLTPEEILALQEKAAQQQATNSNGLDITGAIADAADIALEVLTDAATSTGEVLCAVAGGVGDVVCGIGEVAGDILGALFD